MPHLILALVGAYALEPNCIQATPATRQSRGRAAWEPRGPLPPKSILSPSSSEKEGAETEFSLQALDATYWQEGLVQGLAGVEQGKEIIQDGKGDGIIKAETHISV